LEGDLAPGSHGGCAGARRRSWLRCLDREGGRAARPACMRPPPSRMRLSRTLVAIVGLLCANQASAQAWRRYRGDGFSLAYPPGTTIAPGRSHPNDVPGTVLDMLTSYGHGASTTVTVASFRLPHGKPPAVWVDSVWRAHQPRDTADTGQNAPPRPRRLPGLAAWAYQPYCGDCEAEEVFIGRGDRIVFLGYASDETGRKRSAFNRGRFDRVLRSFRWEPRKAP
jgi:hypothetical protein